MLRLDAVGVTVAVATGGASIRIAGAKKPRIRVDDDGSVKLPRSLSWSIIAMAAFVNAVADVVAAENGDFEQRVDDAVAAGATVDEPERDSKLFRPGPDVT